jgi:hypothetical protein
VLFNQAQSFLLSRDVGATEANFWRQQALVVVTEKPVEPATLQQC